MKGLNKALLPRPFQEFFNKEAVSGLLLILCTIIALVWANSSFSGSYIDLWKTYFTVDIGGAGISKPLILWVNDGLMAVFFFVVGLEIKRELINGELSTPKKAALPLTAAIGGAVIPALIYVGFNLSTPEVSGWGVPMATDIAFALGVLALLGSKTPLSLKIFVTALAIVDDLMAVLVIALFYTAKISFVALAIGFAFLAVSVVLNRLGIQKTVLYVILGVATWVAFLKSGVHATIAGVLFAATIPARTLIDTDEFLEKGERFIEKVRAQFGNPNDQRTAIHYLEEASVHAQTPLERMEHALHSWVAFGVMPVFALANAGVAIAGDVLSDLMSNAIFWGIFLGLFVGKPVGIVAMVWVVVKAKVAELPKGVTWRHIVGAGALAGIGFTMALFIANLAFSDPTTLEIAKLGILSASLASGILGWVLLSSSAESTEPVEQADLEVTPLED